MSDDYHHLPIVPASGSLASHLQALDLLAARLSSLQTRAEWETRVPLNSKASIKGRIVNTGNVKINIGGEWWVDMSPLEGEQWVRRRKAALLEEHAKVLEGWRPGMASSTPAKDNVSSSTTTPRFDPVFRSPIQQQEPMQNDSSGVRRARQPDAVKALVEESTPKSVVSSSVDPVASLEARQAVKGDSKGKSKEHSNVTKAELQGNIPEMPRSVARTSTTPQSAAPTAAEVPKTLASVLSHFMESQNALAQANGSGTMPTGNATEAMINEEGLPIHEIREDENGRLLGDLPTPVAGASDVPIVKDEKDDFWSADAVARREALRRKVFDDPSDSDSESESDLDTTLVETVERSTSPEINPIPPTPSSPTASSTVPGSEPIRRPSSSTSSSTLQPKSILKSSTPRKKSVSFDSSIPIPPDSPAVATTRIGGSTFPTPIINIETGIEEKSVPTLNAPKRSPNRATFGESFAGFKPGFLSSVPNRGKIEPPKPVVLNDSNSMAPSAPKASEANAVPKKKSLFAQRVSEPPTSDSAIIEEKPAFPPMSTATHTSSVKNSIIERPTPSSVSNPEAGPSRLAPSRDRIEGKTAGVSSTVVERPVAGPSRLASHLPVSIHDNEKYEDDDDDDDDDDSFYQDEDDVDEEEEYDLDDALLAREVALAYHQNRAYSQLGQQNTRSQRTAENNTNAEGFDESYIDGYGSDDGEEGEEAGVVLGLPQISMLSDSADGNQRAMPSIINPTPDDLRRFVRVGKLDNGKLVLAPGEEGWSDEDEERDDAQERNREEIRATLLGKGGPVVPKVQERRRGDQAIGLPPVIESASGNGAAVHNVVQERVSTTKAQAEIPDPPKKVSRFRAARMG